MKGVLVFSFTVLTFCLLSLENSTVLAGPPLQIEDDGGFTIHKLNKQFERRNRFNNDIEPKFRLQDKIIPLTYNIAIVPILELATRPYEPWTTIGEVSIRIKVVEATNQIHLHKDPTLIAVALADITLTKAGSSDVVAVQSATYEDESTDIWILQLAATLPRDEEYVLNIRFTGQIPVGKTGLYRADYRDDNGVQKWLATTQFETVGFRKMCPGFDEPRFKAVFTISVGADATRHRALGNSEVLPDPSTDPTYPALPTADYKWTNFRETVKMSSYLVAIVVSDYTAEMADEAILGKKVGIYGPPHLMAQGGGKWAANTSAQLLKAFGDEYNETYAMHKMDSVAIPRDWFEFGAMENYGLNIYRDNALLTYEGISLESNRYSVVSILAHELAHQWFGDLVTCNWWSQIWLNEGFATYVSFLGVEAVAPEYDDRNTFLYNAVHRAQLTDAGGSSHPIINTALQWEVTGMTIFDDISYQKGSSLIRMMEGFLTRDVLREGLRAYLQDRKFDNAVQDDLFRVLNTVAQNHTKLPEGVDLKTIMDTFTLQKGLPLVRVSRAAENRVYISQETFRNNMNAQSIDPTRDGLDPDELWEIPVAITTKSSASVSLEPTLWINKNVALTSLENVNTSEWIIANPDGFGYYRTLYDTHLTQLIQEQLNTDHTAISALSKSQLINDYFRLAEEGYVQYETALGMTKFLTNPPSSKTDRVFWYPALNTFSKYVPLFTDNTGISSLQKYLGPKVEGALDGNGIGWVQQPNEHGVQVMFRATLLDWACSLEQPRCVAYAKELFANWVANKTANPIPVDLQAVVYCTGVANGTQDDYQHVLMEYHHEKEETQKDRLYNALACTDSYENLLELAITSLKLPAASTTSILNNIVKNSVARQRGLAFGFIRDNWEKLVNHTATDAAKDQTNIIPTLISTITNYQTTEKDVENLQALMVDIEAKRPEHFTRIQSSLNSSLRKLQNSIAWMSKNFDSINNWLLANS